MLEKHVMWGNLSGSSPSARTSKAGRETKMGGNCFWLVTSSLFSVTSLVNWIIIFIACVFLLFYKTYICLAIINNEDDCDNYNNGGDTCAHVHVFDAVSKKWFLKSI